MIMALRILESEVADMNDTETTLLDLEQRMLKADAESDAEFFRQYCEDDFMAVSAYGVSPKDQVLEMYSQGSADADRRNEILDPRVVPVSSTSALVTYRLTSTAKGESSSMYSTSVYRQTAAGWRLLFLQQTPL
jgi:hypothetical protein